MSNKIPDPITREEQYLYAIAKNGGGGGGASSADEVTYDNTSSGLNATNVQDAIDEVAQSGGGGESNVAIVDFDYNGGLITSVDDAVDIKALVDSGKALIGIMSPGGGQTVQLAINIIQFTASSGTLITYTYDGNSGQIITLTFTAADLNEGTKFVISG